MKEVLIVNNNMKVGGVQKSLQNLLWSLDPAEYKVTLLLFSKCGAYLDDLPDHVTVVEETGPFRLFGKSQSEYTGLDGIRRAFLAVVSRCFGRDAAVKLLRRHQPNPTTSYDCAVSFLNNGPKDVFYGGAQDYVLYCTDAKRKVVFLHSDYDRSGSHYPENDKMLQQFDVIAACSEGCRRAFVAALPEQADHCLAVRNCHRYDQIRAMAESETVRYEGEALHAVTVARMTPRKGVDRAIRAVAAAQTNGIPMTLHIVGDGPMRRDLEDLAQELGIADSVIFHGEMGNPYPYIRQADLFLLTSYHEAAPMVIEEARCLGVPVLSTEIISTKEMVTEAQAGWVCDNDQQALNEALCRVAADREVLTAVKERLLATAMDNRVALEQFAAAVNN
ncbi:MAG: glycosyltransferase [Clostridia bacterium]|nr:glycosyltransferase [Clostridia bacterium]